MHQAPSTDRCTSSRTSPPCPHRVLSPKACSSSCGKGGEVRSSNGRAGSLAPGSRQHFGGEQLQKARRTLLQSPLILWSKLTWSWNTACWGWKPHAALRLYLQHCRYIQWCNGTVIRSHKDEFSKSDFSYQKMEQVALTVPVSQNYSLYLF